MHLPRFLRPLAAGLLALGAAGCASTALRGTPFYTGEYEARKVSDQNRVNFWPAVYYREPVLSVFWPLFERSPDHLAVRPLFSVYGRERADGKRCYNLIWPLAQNDRIEDSWRVFPLCVGPRTVVVFPLYWHRDHPYARQDGHDAFFPFWIYYRRADTVDLHLLWPIYEHLAGKAETGWRLWPLYGAYASPRGSYRFAFWPLAHWWTRPDGSLQRSLVFPLYYAAREADDRLFLSLLWSSGQGPDGNGWQLLLPLLYRQYGPRRDLLVTPLYAQGREAGMQWRLLVPFYACGRSEQDDWHAVFPLYYRNSRTGTFASGLWCRWGEPDHGGWVAPAAISWGYRDPVRDASYWLGGLLASRHQGPRHEVWGFPFFYYTNDGTFYSPLSGWRRTGNEQFFYPLTPLLGVHRGERPGFWVFPFVDFRHGRTAGTWSGNFLIWGDFHHDETTGSSSWWPFWSYRNYGPLDQEIPGQWGGKRGWETRVLLLGHREETLRVSLQPQVNKIGPAQPPTTRYYRHSGLWPLYSREVEEEPLRGRRDSKHSVLLWLYDSVREERRDLPLVPGTAPQDLAPSAGRVESLSAPPPAPDTARDYLRRRVLWRLWHYERSDGDVSVDAFPAITWDARRDGFRKFSFCWRLLRYERGPDGRKVDFCFLPLWR